MKKLVSLICILVLSTFAFACGEENPEPNGGGSVTTIEFFGWGDAAEQENYQTLVNQFMRDNSDVKVVYRAESASTYMTTLKNRANSLPDLFYMPDYDFLEWAANGMLLDITDYTSAEDLGKLWANAVDEYYFDMDTMALGKSDNARLYGLPKDLGPFTLVYNKTLLDRQIEKLSLNSEEIYEKLDPTKPMTWQEFRALLKMVDPDPNDDLYGISHYELEAAIYSNNADFFDEGAKRQLIDTPEFYNAVQFIVDLHLVDKVMPSAENQQSTNGYQRFKGQGCIFSFMGPWDCTEFWKTANFQFDILPVPYNGENAQAVSTAWVGSMAYCIPAKNAKSSSKVDAAIRLANYLCYDESAQRSFYSLGQQVPNIIEMANNEYLNDSNGLLDGKSPSSRGVWLDTIDGVGENDKIGGKVRSRYYTYSSDWQTQLTDYFTEVNMWGGRTTAEEACKGFAPTFQLSLDEMRSNLGLE